MLRILHLEDDAADAELVLDLLRQEGFDVESDRVDTLEEFKERLARGAHDLVLSDYTMPGVDAVETLRLAQEVRPEVPFVFLSGTLGEDRAIETLKLGATDYVLKQRLGRLAPAVRRALDEAREHAARKQAEVELRKSRARFDGIITSAMDAVISIDRNQQIVLFNPAAEKMFGVSSGEALGQSIERFIPERFRAQHGHDVVVFGRTGVSARQMGTLGTVFGLRADGQEFPIEASISRIEVEGEELFTVILRDITERKRAEEEVRRAGEALARANAELEQRVWERTAQLVEANANLQTFANTAAHDLRSPLRTIRSFTGIALEEFGPRLDPECRSYMERVKQATEAMERLMGDLLDYSRMEQAELRMGTVSLQQAAEEVLALLEGDIRAKNGLVRIEGSLPEVVGHPATVVLIMSNFVSNGLKFVAAGARPEVRIWAERVKAETRDRRSEGNLKSEVRNPKDQASPSADRFEPSTLTSQLSTGLVRLWVEDNGIGIRREDVPKLFGVFQRLHGKQAYPGTGLGLAIVRRGAERMGGRVGVESEPGRGSRFWVELRSAE